MIVGVYHPGNIYQSAVISEWAPTCDNVHSYGDFYNAALMATGADTMTGYPTQSEYRNHSLPYPITRNQSLPYPITTKCQARKSEVSILSGLVWLDQESTSQLFTHAAYTLPIWPLRDLMFVIYINDLASLFHFADNKKEKKIV